MKSLAHFPFQQYTGRGVKVALIDSGVNSSVLPSSRIAQGLSIGVTSDGKVVYAEGYRDITGHGTACAAILLELAPDITLYVIRILGRELMTTASALLAAIEWTVTQHCQLVNVSLGTTQQQHRARFSEICQWACENKTFIVAAISNTGEESLPACLPTVFGAKAGLVHSKYQYLCRPNEPIQFVCDGTLSADSNQYPLKASPETQTTRKNSFAAPRLTGLLARLLEARPDADFATLEQLLVTNAASDEADAEDRFSLAVPFPPKSPSRSSPHKIQPSQIEKATLFPFSEKISYLVRYQDLLQFELAKVGYWPSSHASGPYVGKTAIISYIADLLDEVDTLIIGDTEDYSRILQEDLLSCLVSLALDTGKHVYSPLPVENKFRLQIQKGNLLLGFPMITQDDRSELLNRFVVSGLRCQGAEVECPTVGVFSLRPNIRAFDVQLQLRQSLQGLGYRVGQLGTEPYAPLFGFDYCFPSAYPSSNLLPTENHIPYLRLILKDIYCTTAPEIIVVGAQTGIIPESLKLGGRPRANRLTLPTWEMLLGSNPDAYVLMVDRREALFRIQGIVAGLEAMGGGKVIALALDHREEQVKSDRWIDRIVFQDLSEQELHQAAASLEHSCGLPVVDTVTFSGRKKLVQRVINYFGA